MSLASSRSTQPMSIPWVNARRGQPSRLLVTLERRVSLVVEDGALACWATFASAKAS